MAETTKSVLLVDYDSIHRGLAAGDSGAEARLAPRLASWIGAIEAGSLFAARPDAPSRRRVLIRRCYADPGLLGNDRAAFLANGFQVIDCPPIEGREHNTATIHIVLDCIDALDHPTGYEEFILLSADSDLSPLLIRLRGHNRLTAIYATMATADSYRAIADAVIEEPRFIAALLSDAEPDTEEEEDEEARAPADRSEIEALARKISSATNVPLFAPRTFADLFRHLVEEIAENGYHFQTTAENVATRMADAGRNVSRRQVVFVVKGLALKGHVFSTGDTAERLADVFREQVLYLAENAGLELDDDERRVLSSWIVGQVPTGQSAATRDGETRKVASRAANAEREETAKSTNGRSSRKKPPKPTGSGKPASSGKPGDEAKSAETPKPAATPPATPPEDSKSPAPQRPEAAASKPTVSPAQSSATSPTREKPAASSAATGAGLSASRSTTPTSKTAGAPSLSDADGDGDKETDAVESSILAAIAQAVDVLVEDSGGRPKRTVEPDEAKSGDAEKKAPTPAPEPEPEVVDEGGDDIGDEIQRIIASYSRNRNKGDT